ncbi:hypothetical protein GC176_26465 [bacterium]|nr:hypothetical protein [bacterium]
MSKTNYFLITLVGALPAGGCLYLLIMNLLDRADELTTMLLAVTITAAVCMVLVVISPFIVLFGYKDTRPKLAAAAAGGTAATAAAEAAPKKKGKAATDDEGFGDVIPDDFDEEELVASGDDEYDDLDEEAYDDGDFDDFDMDDDEYA